MTATHSRWLTLAALALVTCARAGGEEKPTPASLLTIKVSSAVRCFAFDPEGKRLAIGSADKTAQVWDTETGKEVVALRGHTNEVWGVAFSPDGKRLATASYDYTARVWDAATGKEQLTLKGHGDFILSCVAFSPDGKRLATAGDDTAKLWDASPPK